MRAPRTASCTTRAPADSSNTASLGYGSGWADAYASHYHSLDLAREVLMREPAGRMYPMHRFLPDSVIDRSEYYQDFYIREGLRYSCGGMRFEGDRRLILAVHRPVNHRPYDAHTVRELQRVLDHCRTSFACAKRPRRRTIVRR
ncbi:hypothetical protein L0Y88_27950 [Burkholderia multivorans]|uniref:hypothetical protein n=1 Tax=Burkholderia multivorans TaxID=87883 RepID=UPI002019DFF3|nr:hypothetical protein [Burkholderia multivorans]UQN56151.1 hypothetical protein L0Y88_27950 [Burkholderia multivorans]